MRQDGAGHHLVSEIRIFLPKILLKYGVAVKIRDDGRTVDSFLPEFVSKNIHPFFCID